MARINIEDSIYKDNRFFKLSLKLGSREAAIGSLIFAWSLAQKFYLNEETNRRIPLSEWDTQEIKNEIIEVKLARVIDGFVEVEGSEKEFNWLFQKSAAGKSLSPKKLKQLEDARSARWEKSLNGSERNQTKVERNVNGSEALTLSLTLSQKEEELSSSEISEPPPPEIQKEEFKPVVNNSAVSNFNARFAPDAHKWDQVLDDYGLKKRLQRHLGAIRNTFDDPQALEDFIETKAKSATAKKILQDHGGDAQKARPSTVEFVMVCIKKEIGVLS